MSVRTAVIVLGVIVALEGLALWSLNARLARLEARLDLAAITGSIQARRLMLDDERALGLGAPVLLAELPLAGPRE